MPFPKLTRYPALTGLYPSLTESLTATIHSPGEVKPTQPQGEVKPTQPQGEVKPTQPQGEVKPTQPQVGTFEPKT